MIVVALDRPEDLDPVGVPVPVDRVAVVVAGRVALDAQRLRDRVGQRLAVVGSEVGCVGEGVGLVVIGARIGDGERVAWGALAGSERNAELLGDGQNLAVDDRRRAAPVRPAGGSVDALLALLTLTLDALGE